MVTQEGTENTGVVPPRRRGRRGRGLDVKPELIREARRQAGLTMAQLAGVELTRGAIHMFESGRARPSRQVLEMIAAKTGRPVSYFIEDSLPTTPSLDSTVLVANVERLVAAGDAVRALEIIETVDVPALPPALATTVRMAAARALIALKRPEEAVLAAADAARTADGVDGLPWLRVQAGLVHAEALYAAENPGARTVADATLAAARQLEPPQPWVVEQLQFLIASLADDRGDTLAAVAGYTSVAEQRVDAEAFRRAAEILGQDGERLQAAHATEQAVAAYARSAALSGVYHRLALGVDARLRVARVRMNQGDLPAAFVALEQAAQAARASGLPRHECRAVLTQADIAMRLDDVEGAEQLLHGGVELARALNERQADGVVHLLRAQLATKRGHFGDAGSEFDAAIADFEATNCTHRLVETRTAYAEMLEADGRLREALEQWKLTAGLSRPELRGEFDGTPG